MGVFQTIVALCRSLVRTQAELAAENLALRQQLAVLEQSAKRPKLQKRDRIFWVWLSRLWPNWRSVLLIVQPDTVVRWHKQGFKLYWRWKSRHKTVGRPKIEAEIRKLIRRMSMAKQIQVCYQTAWLMLQKLRDAMRQRCERYVLQGLVEVDETYVGGREPGRSGRGVEKKIPVGVAVELDKNNRPRRIAMQGMKRVDARSLTGFTTKHVATGSCLRTDGWGSYRSVAKAGYDHRVVITGGGEGAVQVFPWVHTFFGNMKRMILGTYHSVSPKHLDRYLAAFTYRANRRWMEAKLFDRLVIAAVNAKPLTLKELTTGAK